MELWIIPAVIIIVYVLIEKSKQKQDNKPEILSYRVRDDFLSPAELNFYKHIYKATEGWLVVCPKVSMQDIFFPAQGTSKERFAQRSRINRRHTDFLLCTPKDMKPVAGIELDDKSHNSEKTKAIDELKNNVYKTAGIPLIRIAAKKTYKIGELRRLIAKAIQKKQAPMCDKCNIPLVLRIGKNEKLFWGCTNFPQCRETKEFSCG